MDTKLISAVCTPLREDQSLDADAFSAHIQNQFDLGISGVLIGGSMGYMQLLADDTYLQLIEHGTKAAKGRGEVMVGVGDTSFARTRDRIKAIESFDYDAVVILTPYLLKFNQQELVEYFSELATISGRPVMLYDLPGVTGVPLDLDTILKLSEHPNIAGIKSSRPWVDTSQLLDLIQEDFRIIPAQPYMVDKLIRLGVNSNLDGIFAVVPELTTSIVRAAEEGSWQEASKFQNMLSGLLRLLRSGQYNIHPACSALLNARGLAGNYFPWPWKPLQPQQKDKLLGHELVRHILAMVK